VEDLHDGGRQLRSKGILQTEDSWFCGEIRGIGEGRGRGRGEIKNLPNFLRFGEAQQCCRQCMLQRKAWADCRAQRCSGLHICAGYGHELGLFTCSLPCSTQIYTLFCTCKTAYKPSHHTSIDPEKQLSPSVKTYSCTSDL
jgi:hypothetical protein